MLLVYVAIALFTLIILWLALQPKQGTRAANAPDPDDSTRQLPKPPAEHPITRPSSRRQTSYESYSPSEPLPETPPEARPSDIQAPACQEQLRSLMQQGRKIEAIKLVRSTTGWGLKESKTYVEQLPAINPLASSQRPIATTSPMGPPDGSDSNDINERVWQLMQQGRKIEALRLVRSVTGWGLKQTKAYVEKLPNVAPLPTSSSSALVPEPDAVESFDIDRHDLNDRIRLLMKEGRKIGAIKMVRTVTGWDLKESKDYIDHYPDVAPLPVTDHGVISPQIRQLLSEGQSTDAITLVQQRTGMELEEAKTYLEDNFDYQFPV